MKPLLTVTAVSLISFSAGAVLGYKIAYDRLSVDFEERLCREIDAATTYYEKVVTDKQKFATPQEAAAALIGENVESGEQPEEDPAEKSEQRTAYHKIVASEYTPRHAGPFGETQFSSTDEAPEPMFPPNDVDRTTTNVSDRPHVISQEEFIENVSGFVQTTLTYYPVDMVVVDETDTLVEDIESTVGYQNLDRFGEGSSDDNVVHIRNPRMGQEFEVVRHGGSYKQEVLGIEEDQPQPPSGRGR